MIQVTRLNHTPLVLNSDLIEHLEGTPDTVISLSNGQRLMVLESAQEIIDRVVAFRRRIHCSPEICTNESFQPGTGVADHGR